MTLEEELGITRAELKVKFLMQSCIFLYLATYILSTPQDYSVILLIPDLYDHIYVREMTNLLLKGIGFKQLWLQQVLSVPHSSPPYHRC